MFENLFGIDIIFTGACNMKCTYCYIHKDPENMKQYNAKVRQSLLDGSYAKYIKQTFKGKEEQLHSIGLWGAEPTINADCFAPFVNELFDTFPELEHFLMSTNALLGINAIKQFIDPICKYAVQHQVLKTLELQFSLDGPEYINDSTRHPGATKSTITTIKDTIKYYLELIDKNPDVKEYLRLDLHTKPTLDDKWIAYLVEHDDKLIEWFDFLDNLQDECVQLTDGYELPHLDLCMNNLPTIVDPGEHTIEDGKAFAKFIRKLSELDVSRWKYYQHPLNWQFQRSYLHQLGQYKQYIVQPSAYCCSAGRETWSLDYKGDLQPCHRVFDNAYMGLQKRSQELVPVISTEGYQGAARDKKIAALDYTNLLYHGLDGTACRLRFLNYLLQALVITGQYDAHVLDPDFIKLLLQYIGGVSCHFGQLEETGSIYVTTLSYINLLANGAIEELQRYFAISDQLNQEQKGSSDNDSE